MIKTPLSVARTDIKKVVTQFISKSGSNDRYASFDYCYNYFRTTSDLTRDIEKSALMLGFYLASWGMFRGSSFLLQKSAKHFERTIEYVAALDRTVWEIDVDDYTDENIQKIISIYAELKGRLIHNANAELTLITKVLLGVFGFVPAFDSYFSETFRQISNGQCGFRRVNTKSLGFIRTFYEANQVTIDNLSNTTFTIDFATGKTTEIAYPKAKIIDMYGFAASKTSKDFSKR
ncbi:MAG: hypothetical protein KF762_16420 [Acidobacteria bacterium]|nr:hypothetical protein [Acidobacteriota bacterium]